MENINRPYKLHTDNSYQDQPKDTASFILNGVAETSGGDFGFISNEGSTIDCFDLPSQYVPLGSVYMGSGQTALFMTKSDNSESCIGIVDDSCNLVIEVQVALGFARTNQIDAIFRLRNGCERVVYFTDDLNPPRFYNFDRPDDFKTLGVFDPDKFSLIPTYASIPEVDSVSIEETGELEAGGYVFALQYLDADLNPTEFLTHSDSIIIYHDSPESKDYGAVRGSTNAVNFYQDFGKTNKAIRVDLSNLDTSYAFYRFGYAKATNGSGQISQVLFSNQIPTANTSFAITGNNAFTEGTIEELQQFRNHIESARHIIQLENSLLLADIKGSQADLCEYQQYASKIKADLVYETITLNDTSQVNNPKRGTVHMEKTGYQPGEIYAFGIVYILDDNTETPVYHIPGRNATTVSDMSSDNASTTDVYVDNNSCIDYWGTDFEDDVLLGQPVRHHRFPLRSEVSKPLYTETGGGTSGTYDTLFMDYTGSIGGSWPGGDIQVRINYTIDAVAQTKFDTLYEIQFTPGPGSVIGVPVDTVVQPSVIAFVSVEEYNPSTMTWVPFGSVSGLSSTNNLDSESFVSNPPVYQSEIMGIQFSNVEQPPTINGKSVIGYYIVRAKREEEDKTILDNGFLAPLIEESSPDVFASHGHLLPNGAAIKEDAFALVHPEHKFNGRKYSPTEYIQEGQFEVDTKYLSEVVVEDIQPGTSYDSAIHKRRERDADGYSLHGLTRNHLLDYNSVPTSTFATNAQIIDTFYLDALAGKSITDINTDRKEIYNLSSDNRISILQTNVAKAASIFDDKLPYVVMKRDVNNNYSDFMIRPYHKEFTNPEYFDVSPKTVDVFNGDSYISSMRYVSTVHYDISLKLRSAKVSVWNYVLGVLTAVVGAVLTVVGAVVSAGALSAAGVAVIGAGVSIISAGTKKDQIRKVYTDLWEQGLSNTVDDTDTDLYLGDTYRNGTPGQTDDEIQIFMETLTNVWVESGVNMNWRMGSTAGITDFLDSPGQVNTNEVNSYLIEKVSNVDPQADGGRAYQGYIKAEIYDLNKDYTIRSEAKKHFHLPLEYDCCSECQEDFPHRIIKSEVSFQEELSDNYRVFLPNNYIDIEGETGEITNLFKIQNNLYVHTEEALWHLPQNIQERITGDIVSFIGTGSFFAIPPRKILDGDTGYSAGSQHKWGTVKTPYGVFFPSERQRIIYRFDGNKLENLSQKGMFSWFKNNMEVFRDRQYFENTGNVNPVRDNTSSLNGTGFVSAYDSQKERILFTKRDYVEIPGPALQNNSWTLSYNIKLGSWTSFHSYMPEFYMHTPEKFFTWGNNTTKIWQHNSPTSFQTYYGILKPFIVEYVSLSSPVHTRFWEDIELLTEAKKYDASLDFFGDERDTTFNKGIFYNSYQCTGELTLEVKNTKAPSADYLLNQIINQGSTVTIDRNERNWGINDLRDIRTDYTVPIFNADLGSRQTSYFIDKILNTASMDFNKDWTELQLLRDKYLVIRLIFDNLADTQLTLNYSIENETPSIR